MSNPDMLERHFRLASIPNVMFRLETNGISFLHLGDNWTNWPPDVCESVGQVDVLMVTVHNSCHLLSYHQADRLIAQR